jgi:hypothetical protein
LLTTCEAELFESFLNSVLACPLPIDALAAISEVLGIDSSTIDVGSQNQRNDSAQRAIRPDDNLATELTTKRSETMLSLLRAYETDLLRAENTKQPVVVSQAINRQGTLPKSHEHTNKTAWIHEPTVPASVTERFQEAMHEALMNVMSERDEAHARLISANVLHIHELEQEKRKNERLRIEMQVSEEAAKLRRPLNVANLFAKFDDAKTKQLEAKLQSFEQILKTNSDDEMASLSQQLAVEISTKTAHALEIARLKETMEITNANRGAEKDALKEELRRLKQLLLKEQENREMADQEAGHWKSSYEHLAGSIKDEDAGLTDPR